MIAINRILCPIDFSEFSSHALEHAAALARWYESRLTVLHMYAATLPSVASLEYPAPLRLDERLVSQIEEAIRGVVKATCQDVPSDIVVAEGSPAKGTLRYAESLGADLIVMGTHGASGFERIVLGSVTEKVLRKARCPVLTIPPRLTQAPAEPPVFKTILCPVDFSESSDLALSYAFSLAEEADGRLILMHVVEGVHEEDIRETMHFSVPEYWRYRQRDAGARLRAIVPEEARHWCHPEPIVVMGKPYREILRAARDRHAALIVMGVLGRNPVDLALFGSTTHHVVREAPCPVLTVRATKNVMRE